MNRLLRYFHVLFKRRRFVFFNTLALTLVAVVVSLVLPHRYTATARLLPPPENDAFGLSSLLGGGMSGSLTRLRAGMMGAGTPSDLMTGILDSRTIVDDVASKCNITEHYRIKRNSRSEARKQLRKMTSLVTSDEGIVNISVEAKTPQLAADLANCYIEGLDGFLRHSNVSRGRNARVFIERRLNQVEDELAVAQESLEVFQQRHQTYTVDDEAKVAIGMYAELKSRLYGKRAELAMMESVSGLGNPQVASMNRQIRALRSQLARLETGGGDGFGVGFGVSFESLPSVAAEYLRRYRDFRIQDGAYGMLHQQYEYAKILEARDAPALTVLDYAVAPERRSYPRRWLIVFSVFVFSVAASIAFVFVQEYFDCLRVARPVEYEGWREFRSSIVRFVRDLAGPFLRKRH